jgi:peptidoglycan/LPS O-acetylase OafA/YrhL
LDMTDGALLLPTTRRKYLFLDALRGIAAIIVFNLHTAPFWGFLLIHTNLAVDLFFILSGFVIASAYERKLSSGVLSRKEFVIVRLIRLYPMFLLSLLVTAGLTAGRAYLGHHADLMSDSDLGVSFVKTLFFVPSALSHGQLLFPLNLVYWSLFYELIANFVYVLIRPKLTTRVALALIVVTALISISAQFPTATNLGEAGGVFPMLTGFSRGIFGIFTGVMLYRHKSALKAWLGARLCRLISPWTAVILTTILLAFPDLGFANGAFDAVSAVLLLPFLVLMSADGTGDRSARWMTVLGVVSYPLYVLQVPAMELFGFVLNRQKMEHLAPFSGIALLLITIVASLVLERFYDLPLRQRLSSWRRVKPDAATGAKVG